MTQPGTPGSQVPNSGLDDTIMRRFRDVERRVEQLEANALGKNGLVVSGPPGITVQDGAGIVVDDAGVIRSGDFDGDIDTLTPGMAGWALGGLLNGAVLNQLALPNGVIGNDALANPVKSGANKSFASLMDFTTTPTVVASCTLTVPDGFTSATILANMVANGTNPVGTADNLWSRIVVPGVSQSPGPPFGVPAGLSVSATNYYQDIASVTGGQVLTINALAWTTVGTWPGGVGSTNTCAVSAAAIFTR